MTIPTIGKNVPPSVAPFPTKPPMRRRNKILLMIGAILLLLMILLEFNPLHPIWWWHEQARQWHAGEHAGELAKARRLHADSVAAAAAAARAHGAVALPSHVPTATH